MSGGVVTRTLVKRSVSGALYVFALAGTVMTIAGVTLQDIVFSNDCPGWWTIAIILAGLFALLCLVIGVAYLLIFRCGISVSVGGTKVRVKVGDLFAEDGLKVIPFNERFDTEVDDVIISRSSLNGIFIEHYIDDLGDFRGVLNRQERSALSRPSVVEGNLVYELGTVKVYKDYALVAFTHFNELNEAHLSFSDYELCLMNMWRELSRVYAGKRIVLPLMGAGITRFDDIRAKSFDELLRCILCTLRASGAQFKEGVTVVLTKQAASEVQLIDIRSYVQSM